MVKRRRRRTAKVRPLYRPTDFIRRAEPTPKIEGPEAYRTEFRRDFQRLLHSHCFRRLNGKTQLFPSDELDFYRNRLTHSLEVAQVAKSIATKLNATHNYFRRQPIDLDLVEFAGLAHDLGHPPFGHNGEYILDLKMINNGGFEGNAQTLRILSCLEKKATTEQPPTRQFADGEDIRLGLNLTYRCFASVLKYDRQIPRTQKVRRQQNSDQTPCKGYYATELPLVNTMKDRLARGYRGRFKTIECAIMDVADDIAYSTYDLEDAFVAGFLTPISILAVDDAAKQRVADRIAGKIAIEFPDLKVHERTFSIDEMNTNLISIFSTILDIDEQLLSSRSWTGPEISTYVGGEVYKKSALLAKSPYHRTQFTSDLLGFLINKVEIAADSDNPVFWQARLQLEAFKAVETLKLIIFTQLIESDKFLADRRRAKHILERIFDALVDSGADLLPPSWREVYNFYKDDENVIMRTVCDFIAGMTNRHCLEFYARLFGQEPPSIHKP